MSCCQWWRRETCEVGILRWGDSKKLRSSGRLDADEKVELADTPVSINIGRGFLVIESILSAIGNPMFVNHTFAHICERSGEFGESMGTNFSSLFLMDGTVCDTNTEKRSADSEPKSPQPFKDKSARPGRPMELQS